MTWAQIGIFAGAVLVEFGRAMTAESVHAWHDLLTPPVLGAAVLNLGLQLGGLFTKPAEKP